MIGAKHPCLDSFESMETDLPYQRRRHILAETERSETMAAATREGRINRVMLCYDKKLLPGLPHEFVSWSEANESELIWC